jgi:hypothetical protein
MNTAFASLNDLINPKSLKECDNCAERQALLSANLSTITVSIKSTLGLKAAS